MNGTVDSFTRIVSEEGGEISKARVRCSSSKRVRNGKGAEVSAVRSALRRPLPLADRKNRLIPNYGLALREPRFD